MIGSNKTAVAPEIAPDTVLTGDAIGARSGPDGMAIASLAFGALGVLCGAFGVAGLVLGVVSLRRTEGGDGRAASPTIAVAGVVTSTVTVWLWEVLLVLWAHYGAHATVPVINWLLPRV